MTFEETLNSRPGGAKGFIKGLRQSAAKLMNSRSIEGRDSEDMVQTALLNGFLHFDQYNPKWDFSTWMYRIVRNEIFRRNRDHNRHLRLLNLVFTDRSTPSPEKAVIEKLDAPRIMTLRQKKQLRRIRRREGRI